VVSRHVNRGTISDGIFRFPQACDSLRKVVNFHFQFPHDTDLILRVEIYRSIERSQCGNVNT